MSPDRIVAEARLWIGTPYRHGASVRGLGCDCLGLVAGVVEAVTGERIAVPRYAPDWAEATGRDILQEALDRRLVRQKSLPHEAGEGRRPSRPDGVWAGPAVSQDVTQVPSAPRGRVSAPVERCPPHPIRLPSAGTFPSFVGKACPGDILLFRWRSSRPASHLGIATGPATMVHAHARACVAEVAVGPAWARRIAAVYRFPGFC